MHDRLSRWTPLIFAVALANLLVAEVLFLSGVAWPTASLFAGPSLVMVHLTTIGWLTLLMFGALFQFVPVITQQHLLRQDLSLAALVLIELGLLAMIAGFLLLGSGAAAAVLPVGGAVVLAGAVVGVVNLAVPLARKHPLPISGWFIIAGFCFLGVTVLLGISYGIALSVPAFAPFTAKFFGAGIEYHLFAGLGGWFTLTAIGVSYELLPMFMLAPHKRGALGTAVLAVVLAGFVVTIGAGTAQGFAAPGGRVVLVALEWAGRALVAAGVVLYLIDVVRLYRSRKRAHIELHNQVAIGAFVALGLALLLGIAVTVGGAPRGVPAFVLFVMLGWLSGLAMTQLYKIIPFLAWLNRYGNMMGKGRVPRVQDLVNEKKALPIFIAWFAAVLVTVAGVLAERVLVARLADAALFIATLLLVREYWRAWRCSYAASAESTPPKFPFMTKEMAHEHDRAARA